MIFLKTLISFFKNPDYRDLILTTLIFLFIGTQVYHRLEGWSYLDSFYFSMITLTTVGFGDFAPQTDMGKLFTIFYITLGIGMILAFINTVYDHFEKEKEANKKRKADV